MDTAGVRVRARRPEDDEFIHALARSAFTHYSRTPGRFVMTMIEEARANALVAETEGLPRGFAVVSFEALGRAFGPWAQPVVASLDAIAVDLEARRRGIGRVLLSAVESLGRKKQAVSLSLRTAAGNTRAQALFRSAGFQVMAELPGYYRGGQTALAMTKWLGGRQGA
jgi:ribosomal-protein-alanine N-acetyltransferase